jgi:hypothetical protein
VAFWQDYGGVDKVTIQEFLDQFVMTPEGGVVAANVDDGIALGMYPESLAKTFFSDAYAAAGTNGVPAKEFFRCMEDVCFGRATATVVYLGACQHGVDHRYPEMHFSIVLPAGALERFASPDDHRRFAGLTGDISSRDASWIDRVAGLEPIERYIRLDPLKSFGSNVVWITPTSVIETILSEPEDTTRTKSDICRDLLGLVSRQPPTILVAFHVPASVFRTIRNFRPTFIEANSHSRFACRPRSSSVPRDDPFGRTIDLQYFAQHAQLHDGAPERITLPFTARDFDPADVIRFDVLGKLGVPAAPGGPCNDDTAAFSLTLRGVRTNAQLLSNLV